MSAEDDFQHQMQNLVPRKGKQGVLF